LTNRQTRVCFSIYGNYEVRVIVARDIVRTGKRLGADLTGAAGAFIDRADAPGVGWLVLEPDADAAIVAHEANHAVRAIFRYVGARADDEAFAYHLGYLVGRIHKFLKGHNAV
jgi:hypothetical protein